MLGIIFPSLPQKYQLDPIYFKKIPYLKVDNQNIVIASKGYDR